MHLIDGFVDNVQGPPAKPENLWLCQPTRGNALRVPFGCGLDFKSSWPNHLFSFTMCVGGVMRRHGINRRGATATEYGLLASLIAVVMLASLTVVGEGASCTFTRVSWEIEISRYSSMPGKNAVIWDHNFQFPECDPIPDAT